MAAKGKRKAQEEAVLSAKKTAKRKTADAEDMQSELEEDEVEDIGREQSENIIKLIGPTKPMDEKWTKETMDKISASEATLNAIVDAKEQELNTLDNDFRSGMRSLLTSVLGEPSDGPPLSSHYKRRTNASGVHANPRPGFGHAQLLFAKSERLLRSFTIVNEAIENAAAHTDQTIRFEKDKEDVSRLLRLGQEISRRKIQIVLRRPEEDMSRKKKNKTKVEGFEQDKLDEAATIFDALKNVNDQEDEEEEDGDDEDKIDVADGPGLYPILHDAKKGLKRLAGGIVIDME